MTSLKDSKSERATSRSTFRVVKTLVLQLSFLKMKRKLKEQSVSSTKRRSKEGGLVSLLQSLDAVVVVVVVKATSDAVCLSTDK